MGRLLRPLLALLASATRQELARQVAYLKEENRILRARLSERIVTTPAERRWLLRDGCRLGHQLGHQQRELISIVSYRIFRRWIREAESAHATKTSAPRR
jgi:putative transposase